MGEFLTFRRDAIATEQGVDVLSVHPFVLVKLVDAVRRVAA
jgi:hypothetical protein